MLCVGWLYAQVTSCSVGVVGFIVAWLLIALCRLLGPGCRLSVLVVNLNVVVSVASSGWTRRNF